MCVATKTFKPGDIVFEDNAFVYASELPNRCHKSTSHTRNCPTGVTNQPIIHLVTIRTRGWEESTTYTYDIKCKDSSRGEK